MLKKIGGQPGNNNATKNKPITEELTKVLHEECEHKGEKTIKLRKLVSVWVDSALDGDRTATKEIVNRIEGTPVQCFEGDVDGVGLVVNILRLTDADDTNVIEHEDDTDTDPIAIEDNATITKS